MGKAAVAEKQPRAAACACGATLLHKRAERRNSGARPYHDDVAVGRRKRETLVGLQFHPQPAALSEPFGNKCGGYALPGASVGLVAHGGDEDMRFIRELAL